MSDRGAREANERMAHREVLSALGELLDEMRRLREVLEARAEQPVPAEPPFRIGTIKRGAGPNPTYPLTEADVDPPFATAAVAGAEKPAPAKAFPFHASNFPTEWKADYLGSQPPSDAGGANCTLCALAAKCEARGREVSRLQAKLHRQRVARKRANEAKGKQPVPAGPTGGAEARVAEKCTCDDGSGVLCAFCLRTGQEEAQPAPSLAADRDEARKDAADYAYNLQQFRVQVDSLAAERDRLKRELADCDCALNRPCLSAIRTRLQVPPTESVDDAVAACADERDRLQGLLDASRHANSILVGKFGKAERERDEANVARDATDKRIEEVQSELSTATRLNTKWMDEATNAKIAQEIAETRAQKAERMLAVIASLGTPATLRKWAEDGRRGGWADEFIQRMNKLADAIELGPEGPSDASGGDAEGEAAQDRTPPLIKAEDRREGEDQ